MTTQPQLAAQPPLLREEGNLFPLEFMQFLARVVSGSSHKFKSGSASENVGDSGQIDRSRHPSGGTNARECGGGNARRVHGTRRIEWLAVKHVGDGTTKMAALFKPDHCLLFDDSSARR
jgi:hypothetical protein